MSVTITGRRSRRIGALVVVIALAITACSSSKKESSSTTEPSASKIDTNGVLRLGYALIQEGGLAAFGDPAKAGNNATANDALYYLIYGRFMKLNEDGTLTPDLAKSATIVDNNTIEIVLRDGLKFSDGTAFDAAAVKAGLDRSLAANNVASFQPAFFELETVEVVNATTVKLNFPGGTAAGWYDQFIGSWQVSIVKPGETNFELPAGAGPMMAVSYDAAQQFKLKRNPNYWNVKNVHFAGMDLTHVDFASPGSGLAALRSGQIDSVTTEASQIDTVTGDLKVYKRVSPDQNVWVHICKREGPLANAKVRTALNKLFDRDAINKTVFKDTAAPSTQLWPKGHKFNVPELDDEFAYDPAGAKKLLQEAGYADGFSVELYPIDFAGIGDVAEIFKQEAAKVGVTINIKTGGNYVNDFLVPKKAALGMYPGNSGGLLKLNGYTGASVGNVCAYDNPELTSIQQQLSKVSASDPKAVELWKDAAEIVVGEALSGFVLFRSQLAAYDSTRIGDMKALVLGQFLTPDPVVSYIKAE
jgi:peptide/nickel transport system substrate-binding protein